MNYIAAMLLMHMDVAEAFVAMASILNEPLMMGIYTEENAEMRKSMGLFLRAFKAKLPQLYAHFHENLGLPPALYLGEVLRTAFAMHLHPDLTSRIWDVFAFRGDMFLLQAALGMLIVLESKLYGDKDEVMALLGWTERPWQLLQDDETLMDIIHHAGRNDNV